MALIRTKHFTQRHAQAAGGADFRDTAGKTYAKLMNKPLYRLLLFAAGLPFQLLVLLFYGLRRRSDPHRQARSDIVRELRETGFEAQLTDEAQRELAGKYRFFGQQVSEGRLHRETAVLVRKRLAEEADSKLQARVRASAVPQVTLAGTFRSLLDSPGLLALSVLAGPLMHALLFIYSKPYLKYVFDRLVMMVFVIFGVTFLVFTILYFSPLDPAANILGQSATQEQLAQFNQIYGLDQPYLVQLWRTFQGLLTFDLGKSYSGSEEVAAEILRKLPITLNLTVLSLIIAVAMALPSGILSATRQYSFLDYSFMLLVLLGLSIPDFWQGLVFILNFSIKLHWLPATYNPQAWVSLLMPAIVLGTSLAASVARMTRSSTLEVIHQDYIITARAKGLSERKVILKHALGNALIPIVTIIGVQFGNMLGGAAVTEKVFNMNGVGSYIVDKQFIPDIPGILAGVVYVAVTISIVNLIVDLIYAFLDPRIRSKMKDY